jgi:flagellar biosynthesis protein
MSGTTENGRIDRPRQAVALEYARDAGGAPRVVAKGRGEVAERILELAAEHGVPMESNADLAELLGACDVGDEIPEELYVVVAELLRYLFALNGELADAAADAV